MPLRKQQSIRSRRMPCILAEISFYLTNDAQMLLRNAENWEELIIGKMSDPKPTLCVVEYDSTNGIAVYFDSENFPHSSLR